MLDKLEKIVEAYQSLYTSIHAMIVAGLVSLLYWVLGSEQDLMGIFVFVFVFICFVSVIDNLQIIAKNSKSSSIYIITEKNDEA